jgi:hypothetical protein
MAHFARVEHGVVREVIVINNEVITDTNGQEEEQLGIDFSKSLYGEDTEWVQTSYNANFRGNFAGIGYTYDAIADAFIPPMPDCGHEELLLNAVKRWECSNPEHDIRPIDELLE